MPCPLTHAHTRTYICPPAEHPLASRIVQVRRVCCYQPLASARKVWPCSPSTSSLTKTALRLIIMFVQHHYQHHSFYFYFYFLLLLLLLFLGVLLLGFLLIVVVATLSIGDSATCADGLREDD
jgi:hypothetical protein